MNPGARMLRPAAAARPHPAGHDVAALRRLADMAVAQRQMMDVEHVLLCAGRAVAAQTAEPAEQQAANRIMVGSPGPAQIARVILRYRARRADARVPLPLAKAAQRCTIGPTKSKERYGRQPAPQARRRRPQSGMSNDRYERSGELSAPKPGPGWRPIARPRCAMAADRPSADDDGGLGRAQADLQAIRIPSSGSTAWPRRAGPRPTWPKDYGGGGLSQRRSQGARPGNGAHQGAARRSSPSACGCWGRCCSNTATRSRRRNICPRSCRGEIRWCQGYSEPGAGSDLAGLRTRCEDKGDHYLINGQKVWTSYADKADWIFCLVRTDTTKKHEGISFILFDMTSARRRSPPDQADQRPFAVLRNLLHRREGAEGKSGRQAERRLGNRQAPAAI